MKLYRTSHRRFDLSSPAGSIAQEGRWHHAGVPVLYCAESLALAVLEQCVNGNPLAKVRDAFHFSAVETGGAAVESTPDGLYATNWRSAQHLTRDFGTQWALERRTPILRIRSAALSDEWNCLLNTAHPDFSKIRFSGAKPIALDERF